MKVTVCRGQTLPPDDFARQITAAGYRRVPHVHDPGDWARRGGVADCFPDGFDAPVRLEWEADTVVGIRSIHPETGAPFFDHAMVLLPPVQGVRARRVRTVGLALASETVPIEQFVDIEAGDLIVHVTHGIGRYLGLQKARIGARLVDHLVIEYADEAMLYVPVDELHLVQKYLGFEGYRPALSTLGTKLWERIKARARASVRSVAFELLAVQAQRASRPGHAFSPDTDWQRELEQAFPYPETPGQRQAAAEVKRDMESPQPMDRLLCGDVGYGKTEVALRAAFKAVLDDLQVALLCPTTILAEQHAETFRRRLERFPVNVQMLSRFQTPAAQQQILEGVKTGQVDLVIGTHRLLSPDVHFKNLGLVIIDEEQRFGVRHKEHLKRLRAVVDVLTLTATPIPRTLSMALMGARDLSLIDTPPARRLPVKTVVAEARDALLREALARELARGGQVFAVYPWVQGVERVARRLQALAPAATVRVAHGQMPSRALEQTMLAFLRRQVDVLVSTAIIESGIDVPNANTLVVFQADSFGLADLYQLRGRVGRFIRQAYAYLLTEPKAVLTREAQKRLEAIQKFAGLGAGFQIALEDLQLRGAGNLLGVEQHGHICAVGFDLYCRLLKAEIARLRRESGAESGAESVAKPAGSVVQ